MKRNSTVRVLVTAGLMTFVAGALPACEQGGSPRPNSADHRSSATETFQHVVQPGETLGMIADWYTGKSSNWKQIVDVNPGLRPERMRVGQIVLIPRSILIKDTPIPRGYVSAKKKSAPANATGVDTSPSEADKDSGSEKTASKSADSEVSTSPDAVKDSADKASAEAVKAGETAASAAEEAAKAEETAKIEEAAKKAQTEAEAAGQAAQEAADAAKAEAEKAAEKARAEAAAAAKAAADAAEAAKSGQKPAADDAEREKLLDELLAQ